MSSVSQTDSEINAGAGLHERISNYKARIAAIDARTMGFLAKTGGNSTPEVRRSQREGERLRGQLDGLLAKQESGNVAPEVLKLGLWLLVITRAIAALVNLTLGHIVSTRIRGLLAPDTLDLVLENSEFPAKLGFIGFAQGYQTTL